ncbi:MAG: hypothetical protein JW942_09555 [Opitutales bacterium]|nr:hypothetical protein [Opitutales bacterium]
MKIPPPLFACAAICLTSSVSHAALDAILMGRMKLSLQQDANTVVTSAIGGEGPYAFGYEVNETSTSLFSAVTATAPGKTAQSFSYSDGSWGLMSNFSTLEALNTASPTGTYTIRLTRKTGGTVSETLSMTSAARNFPAVPKLSNFDDVFISNSSQTITFNWNAWASTGIVGTTMLQIVDGNGNLVHDSSDYYDDGISPGTSTYYLSANSLTAGKKYFLKLIFMDVPSLVECSNFSGVPKGTFSATGTEVEFYTAIATDMESRMSVECIREMRWTLHNSKGSMDAHASLPGTVSERVIYDTRSSTSTPIGSVYLYSAENNIDRINATGSYVENGYVHYVFDGISPWLETDDFTVMINPDNGGSCYRGAYSSLPAQSKDYVFVPTLTLDNGVVSSISAQRFNMAGTNIGLPSGGVIEYSIASASVGQSKYTATPSSPSVNLASANIAADDLLRIEVSYRESSSSKAYYVSAYTIRREANLFEHLSHNGNWIVPQGNVRDSFGIVSDLLFPYIYNANADALANGSYQGDGSGYMYVFPDGDLSDGFYAYRYATGTWCWTSYDWSGWLYDYGNGSTPASWVDLTPARQ